MPNTIELEAKIYWANGLKVLDKYGKYVAPFYFSPESMDKFMSLGVKNVLRKDDKGYFAYLSRQHKKDMGTKEVVLGPPKVTDMDGKPFDQIIGNGSKVIAVLEYYPHNTPEGPGKGRAIRLDQVKVKELIPYIPKEPAQAEPEKPKYNW